MAFFHVTPGRNRSSIERRGILASKSKGKLRAVWLVDEARLAWAVLHVHKRHKVKVESIIAIEVHASKGNLKRTGRDGLYYRFEDVVPQELGGVLDYDTLASDEPADSLAAEYAALKEEVEQLAG